MTRGDPKQRVRDQFRDVNTAARWLGRIRIAVEGSAGVLTDGSGEPLNGAGEAKHCEHEAGRCRWRSAVETLAELGKVPAADPAVDVDADEVVELLIWPAKLPTPAQRKTSRSEMR